jgi:hypothetical protein
MPLSPTAGALLVGAGVALAIVLREMWFRARRHDAPPAIFGLMVGGTAVWVAVAAGALMGALPVGAVTLPTVAILLFAVLGHLLIPMLGGPVGTSDLLRAYTEIGALVMRPDLTPSEVDGLRRKITRLRRYRNPKTAKFIDAAQSMLLDWADGRLSDPDEREARRQPVLSLGDEVFLGDDG